PDAEFDRQWAITVMARAMDALEAECTADGEGDFFTAVRGILGGQADRGAMTQLAVERGMSFDALRVAVHRMRRRLRDCVKAEVAGTLEDPATVQEEMEALFSALGK
ncbi:MAG: sigma-70 family RNA polymerase sigma factor, partial [Verrucomicrobiales bacterium]|nr:sigma-70 family RNA polymerase sigma factor [Verrucomicrobiales bacterium]